MLSGDEAYSSFARNESNAVAQAAHNPSEGKNSDFHNIKLLLDASDHISATKPNMGINIAASTKIFDGLPRNGKTKEATNRP